jgi:FixJ family two-component response regulator
MPGLTGVELANQLRAKRSDMKVLYMSGYTADVLNNASMSDTNQINFIQKPFRTSALVTKVQEILSNNS